MSTEHSLPLLLEQLKLKAMHNHWQVIAEKGRQERLTYEHFLKELCEQELAYRQQRRIERWVKEAHLPLGKTWSHFQLDALSPSIKAQVQHVARDTQWVHQTENLLLLGPSGVGKTHLSAALSYDLINQNIPVRFFTATLLVQYLQQAKRELLLEKYLFKLDKYRLIVIDDLGYVKKSEQETSVLFELIAHRYETGSLLITSNQPFSQWDAIFTDPVMTVAAVDRLVHHSTIIELNLESYRKKTSTASKEKMIN